MLARAEAGGRVSGRGRPRSRPPSCRGSAPPSTLRERRIRRERGRAGNEARIYSRGAARAERAGLARQGGSPTVSRREKFSDVICHHWNTSNSTCAKRVRARGGSGAQGGAPGYRCSERFLSAYSVIVHLGDPVPARCFFTSLLLASETLDRKRSHGSFISSEDSAL